MRKPFLIIIGALLIISLGLLAGCGGPDEQASNNTTTTVNYSDAPAGENEEIAETGKDEDIKIANFRFDPEELTVPKGTTVIWENKDAAPHTVEARNGAFKSGRLEDNQKFSHTFTTSGTFEYFCGLHPSMTGKIIVK